jgi:hypothetical protein
MHDHQRGAVAVDRLRKIRQLLDSFEEGECNAAKTLSHISDVVSGESERIVRVGHKPHEPEIQT